MSTQNNKLDFTDQEFNIGIDVHDKNWVVSIRNNKMELKTFSMNPSPKELYRHMNHNYPGGQYNSAYEAGFSGFWAHRELEKLGIKNIVIHAADVPITNKEKTNKDDKIDARKIARELDNNSLNSIYIPNEFNQQLRSLNRLRSRAVVSQTRVKNRIISHLYYYGITVPSNQEMPRWSGYFINWLKSIEFKHKTAKTYLLFCLEELLQHRKRIAQILRELKLYIKEHDLYQQIEYIRSVPGIGYVSAMVFYTEIMDINRFKKFDNLLSLVGLVPSTASSGDKSSEKGLTPRRNRFLRHMIIESAWVAVRKDPALLAAFNKLTKRMKKQDAIIRIAKKLLNRIRYVWKNQTYYVNAVIE